ncbi:hypothetical protein [Nocardiopsis sp. NRRL B-16309]|uniref:hypothetical protein n=1 Tax=Nocardiopsis sp. NRRL B-16309 TaxID=1519494 RepID=UPI0018CFF74C|nr:hypothetical protein [Nocardiopsis sp. NRRL B-16309]
MDIIGSERITAWGVSLQGKTAEVRLYAVGLASGGSFAVFEVSGLNDVVARAWPWPGDLVVARVLFFIVAVALALGIERFAGPAVVGVGRLLARPRFEWWLRVIAAPLFFIGFVLDYLAS